MRSKKSVLLAMSALLALALWGCGSNKDGGVMTPTTNIADAGRTGNCTVCHNIDTHTFLNGIAGVNPSAVGLGSAITHDCENCHGGGQYHHGVGPIPYPSPNLDRCSVCHTTQGTKILASAHNYNTDGADPANAIVLKSEHYVQGVCVRCHTSEGFMALKDITGNETAIEAGYAAAEAAGQVPASFDAAGNSIIHNPVCGTCHNPLTKSMIVPPAWAPNGSTSGQLATCTACHNYKQNGPDGLIFATGGTYDVADGAGGTVTTSTDQVGHHDTSWYRIIPTTHFDNPGSPASIEGYNIRENSASPCFDCHGHELKTNTRNADLADPTTLTIHTQWALSGHAGNLLEAKLAAAAANPVSGSRGSVENTTTGHAQVEAVLAAGTGKGAWNDYPWSATNDTIYGVYALSECQQCHTSTGYANKMDALASGGPYVAADNTFTHLKDWTAGNGEDFILNPTTVTGGSNQYELAYCWACHTNAEAGTIRAKGPMTLDYTVGGEAVVIPDLGNSNACINCHVGWGSEGPNGINTDARGPLHHLPSAAIVFAAETHIAAEFPGQDYVIGYFKHRDIGIADTSGTGTSGPCVGCHMTGDGTGPDHTWAIIKHDADGVAYVPQATQDFCAKCHAGHGDVTATFLEEESADYQSAGQLVKDLLGNTVLTNYANAAITSASTGNDLLAYFNGGLAAADPGGYAHNRQYVKKILFDSIDWLDNGVFDGQITIPAAYAGAAAWFRADAVTGVATRP